jgi:LmbE family N-acetylglucosaminyl deacetylase
VHTLSLGLNKGAAPPTILLLGAHSDDIEIGAGGTVLRLAQEFPLAHFHWVTFSASNERAAEARSSFECFMTQPANCELALHEFRDGFFPYEGARLKECFEALKQQIQPSLIFTHYRDDAHQDHRLVSELTRNTFRNHLILEYEIPKYDGDLGRPNLFLTMTAATMQEKSRNILRCFGSQRGRSWFTEDTFTSLARLRGVECNAETGYAEAFYAHKLRL